MLHLTAIDSGFGDSLRQKASLFVAITILASAGTLPLRASAESIATKLERARGVRARAVITLRRAEHRLDELMAGYRDAQLKLEDVSKQVLAAYEAKVAAELQLRAAQGALDREASQAYQAGPGFAMEAILGMAHMGDLAAAEEFATRAFQVGAETVRRVQDLRVSLQIATETLSRRQSALSTTVKRLADLSSEMQHEVATARAAARAAGRVVRRLEQQKQALELAQAAVRAQLAQLAQSQRYASLMQRLALLGPNQGRGCDIPSTLRDTGQRMSGLASWYGDDTITATGDPFDPNLFTAANKELPLNVYIRVHYNGNCAILLVNDRGPYGYGRVFDLSEGAATYLGYHEAGVVWVTADVLVPSS
jgi:rare lipoprotein A (peptidoglycan hydrolase)